jgi:hypothetical protein
MKVRSLALTEEFHGYSPYVSHDYLGTSKLSDRYLGDESISFPRMVKKLWDGCPGRINIVIVLFGLSPLGV